MKKKNIVFGFPSCYRLREDIKSSFDVVNMNTSNFIQKYLAIRSDVGFIPKRVQKKYEFVEKLVLICTIC